MLPPSTAGFLVSGSGGYGLVVARITEDVWSAPSLIGVGGMGGGFQVGISKTDAVLILNNEDAVKAFSGKAQVKLGSELSVAAGPVWNINFFF